MVCVSKDAQNHDGREALIQMTRGDSENVDVGLRRLHDRNVSACLLLATEASEEPERFRALHTKQDKALLRHFANEAGFGARWLRNLEHVRLLHAWQPRKSGIERDAVKRSQRDVRADL